MSALDLIHMIWSTDDELRQCLIVDHQQQQHSLSPLTISLPDDKLDHDISTCLMQDFEDVTTMMNPRGGKRVTPRKLPLNVMHYSRVERQSIGKAFKHLEREDELRLFKERLDDSLNILIQIQGSLSSEIHSMKRLKEDFESYIEDQDEDDDDT